MRIGGKSRAKWRAVRPDGKPEMNAGMVEVTYNGRMPLSNPSKRRQKSTPPGETGQEALYLRFLSEKQVPITVKLRDGESVSGWIEYFDDRMIRLTREGKPNLFIYKHQIRTISENARRGDESRRQHARKRAEAHGHDSGQRSGEIAVQGSDDGPGSHSGDSDS
jgi:host factor-I protein